MKKRQRDKILKIVAKQINSGNFSKLKPVHFRCVTRTFGDYIDKKYINEWRPWWYDQIDNWGNMSLSEEHKKFFDQCLQELQVWTGIDMEKYHQYYSINHKDEPKKKRGKLKERKPIEQPIRKLKNPREYKIAIMDEGKKTWKSIIGEPAFQYCGYDFFITHDGDWWVVSDVATGSRVVWHDRYKKAIEIAKERVEKQFDSYLAYVASQSA